jgi:hypothetical protein
MPWPGGLFDAAPFGDMPWAAPPLSPQKQRRGRPMTKEQQASMQAGQKRKRESVSARRNYLGVYQKRIMLPPGRSKSADPAPKAPKKLTWEQRERALRADMRAKLDEASGRTGQGVVVTPERAYSALAAYWLNEDS